MSLLNGVEAVEAIATKGPFAILDIIPGWAWALVVAALMTWIGMDTLRLGASETKLAQAHQEYSELVASGEKKAREASEQYRKLEAQRNADKEKNDAVVAQERGKTVAAVVAGARTRSMLIDATAKLTARSGAGPGDSEALRRAEQTAAAFGELLGKCDSVAADLGRDVEDLATQVRGLQAADASLRKSLVAAPVLGGPLADGSQVDPHTPAGRRGVVGAGNPVLALDARVDGDAAFLGKQP